MSRRKKTQELSENIEVVGPGQLLAEAREKAGFTQQYVADKLNFRKALVENIEKDNFDKSLPSTYNRGYLRNYAKLVEISVDDVLTSYEMLGHAQVQGAEMQSFSKITKKETENSILMWISYLILALLIGSTAMWWLQGEKSSIDASNTKINTPSGTLSNLPQTLSEHSNTNNSEEIVEDSPSLIPTSEQPSQDNNVVGESSQVLSGEAKSVVDSSEPSTEEEAQPIEEVPIPLSQVTFLFSGDCWVNIYDANGERIAWGVKKAGYEMNISGVAPLSITLGKPELVQIIFESKAVDMSHFDKGNIAKFVLPFPE